MAFISQCPFPKHFQLDHSLEEDSLSIATGASEATLPGYPMISLQQVQETYEFVLEDLYCPKLARMSDHLWLMSTHSHTNITPLHEQSLRGRSVVVMEHPGLHLVWIHDRIFVKPIPKYLLSFEFWKTYLLNRLSPSKGEVPLVPSALGLLRTYFYLIRYESDFRIAQRADLQLVPKGITWDQFCHLRNSLHRISDDRVSTRYQYGELRLTRLDIWAIPLLGTIRYRYVGLQYSDLFAPYFAPLLFIFGVFAILLNAMQVGLAVEALDPYHWTQFWAVSRWFAVVSMFMTVVPAVALLLVLCHRVADEWIFALRQRYRRRSNNEP